MQAMSPTLPILTGFGVVLFYLLIDLVKAPPPGGIGFPENLPLKKRRGGGARFLALTFAEKRLKPDASNSLRLKDWRTYKKNLRTICVESPHF